MKEFIIQTKSNPKKEKDGTGEMLACLGSKVSSIPKQWMSWRERGPPGWLVLSGSMARTQMAPPTGSGSTATFPPGLPTVCR